MKVKDLLEIYAKDRGLDIIDHATGEVLDMVNDKSQVKEELKGLTVKKFSSPPSSAFITLEV